MTTHTHEQRARLKELVEAKAEHFLGRPDSEAAAREVFASVALDLLANLEAAEAREKSMLRTMRKMSNALSSALLDYEGHSSKETLCHDCIVLAEDALKDADLFLEVKP